MDDFSKKCHICAGGEFDLDEDENLICVLCGTVSNQYLSQTKDIEDGSALLLSSKRHSLKRQRRALPHEHIGRKRKYVRRCVHATSVESYFLLQRDCLNFVCEYLKGKFGVDIVIGLRDIFGRYLEASVQKCVSLQNEQTFMILPSMAQLLSFLYTIMLCHNFPITHSLFSETVSESLKMWCGSLFGEAGEYKIEAASLQLLKHFRKLTHAQRTFMLTTSKCGTNPFVNIWYHTNLLSNLLSFGIPTVNVLTNKRQLLVDLGLPTGVLRMLKQRDSKSSLKLEQSFTNLILRKASKTMTTKPMKLQQPHLPTRNSHTSDCHHHHHLHRGKYLRWLHESIPLRTSRLVQSRTRRLIVATPLSATDATALVHRGKKTKSLAYRSERQVHQQSFERISSISFIERLRNNVVGGLHILYLREDE